MSKIGKENAERKTKGIGRLRRGIPFLKNDTGEVSRRMQVRKKKKKENKVGKQKNIRVNIYREQSERITVITFRH